VSDGSGRLAHATFCYFMVGYGASSRVVILGFGRVARTTFPLIQRLFPNMEHVLVDRESFTERDLMATRGTPVTCLQRTFAPGNIASAIDDVRRDSDLVQSPYRREASIGGTPLYKKQLNMFLQIFNILRKKGEINFKIGGIGQAFAFILLSSKVRNSINEKGVMINFWPNRTVNDHVLIMMIDVNSERCERSK
jgi:hypothetical protein